MDKPRTSGAMKRRANSTTDLNHLPIKRHCVSQTKPIPKKARRKFINLDYKRNNDLYKGWTTDQELWKLYKDKEVIGEGGFGTVYGARRVSDTLPVALKFSLKEKAFRTRVGSQNIPSEAYYMKQVSGHPNIIDLYEYYQTAGHYVLVMERPEDCDDMFVHLQDGQPVSEQTAKEIFQQVVSAVQHCHARGVVHNDIKDENILYDRETGTLKIIDFGLSETLKSTPKTLFVGTRLYGPPEWFKDGFYDQVKATVWTLGNLLHVLLCGICPFETVEEITGKKNFIFLDGLSQESRDLVDWMLVKDPTHRPSLEMIANHPWVQD